MVRVAEAHAVALDGFHHLVYCIVLGDDFCLKRISHTLESLAFRFRHALSRDARHSADHISNMIFLYHDAMTRVSMFPLLTNLFDFLLLMGLKVA